MMKYTILPLLLSVLFFACTEKKETNETLLKITANGKPVPLERYANWFNLDTIKYRIDKTQCKGVSIQINKDLATISKGTCSQESFERLLKNRRQKIDFILNMPQVTFNLDDVEAPTSVGVKHKTEAEISYVLLPYDFVASILDYGE